jgi:hypothetical protein
MTSSSCGQPVTTLVIRTIHGKVTTMNEHEASMEAKTPKEMSPEETAPVVDSPEASKGEIPDVRLKRIQDYLGDALGKANTLKAMVGATNIDLMLIGYRLKQAIEEPLSAEPNSLEQFEQS